METEENIHKNQQHHQTKIRPPKISIFDQSRDVHHIFISVSGLIGKILLHSMFTVWSYFPLATLIRGAKCKQCLFQGSVIHLKEIGYTYT